MRTAWLLAGLMNVLVTAPLAAQQGARAAREDVFTDPQQAGVDFKLQGEYAGEIAGGGKLGAQVVALGEHKFTVNLLTGGLPGEGWDTRSKVQVPGAMSPLPPSPAQGLASFAANGWSGDIVAADPGGHVSGKTPDGKEFRLEKVSRHSPTEGAKAPAGALVLFDGTNTDQWRNGKLVEGNLLRWGAVSKQSFGDLKAHIEFRLPFKPGARGQERGNSGIKLQQRYELQILDSFGLKGDQHECGAIYLQTGPAVNMCYPPLSWQTYDVDFQQAKYDAAGKKTANAVVTLIHNGVTVLDHVEILHKTGASKAEAPGPAPLELQDHGNPVPFRNVWVVGPQ